MGSDTEHRYRRSYLVADVEAWRQATKLLPQVTYNGSETWLFTGTRSSLSVDRRQPAFTANTEQLTDDRDLEDGLLVISTETHSGETTAARDSYVVALPDELATTLGFAPEGVYCLYREHVFETHNPRLTVREYLQLPSQPLVATFIFSQQRRATGFNPPSWCGPAVSDRDLLVKLGVLGASESYVSLANRLVRQEYHAMPILSLPGGVEYERRFLVDPRLDPTRNSRGELIVQAYITTSSDAALRIRLSDADDAIVTLKGPRVDGARVEFECALPYGVGAEIVNEANYVIRKERKSMMVDGNTWDVDHFLGEHAPHIIAECEFSSAEAMKALGKPSFCTDEITGDKQYNNERLAIDGWPGPEGAQASGMPEN